MIRRVFILVMALVLGARAESPAEALAAAGVAEFASAYRAWSGERFAAAAELFRQAGTNAGATATNLYWLGVAEFHLALQLRGACTNAGGADAALDAAVAALSQAVKRDERLAEGYALLGTIYGMRINGSLLRAAWFGPRVASYRGKALEYGAANPRVQYLLGVCQFHTSQKKAAWEEALTTLLRAEKFFEAEARNPAAPLEPRWGQGACLTFIGRTYEALGQRPAAAAYFRKALDLHPEDHLAQAGWERTAESR